MSANEIHLNRKAINSMENPAQVQAEAGKTLVLSFNNHGHPLHVSLSAMNPARFASFTHENLFIQGQTEFENPIFEDAEEGVFSIEVVTGYGRTKGEMKVIVRKPLPEQVEKKEEKEPERRKVPLAPDCSHRGRAHPVCSLFARRDPQGPRLLRAPRRSPPHMAAAGLVLAAALGVDRAIGDPPSRYHPVALLGRFIGWWGTRAVEPRMRKATGAICGIGTACLFALPFLLVDRFAPFLAALILGPFLLKITFAWRALEEHARAVDAGVKENLEEGREAVGR